MVLRDDARNRPLYAVMFANPPVSDPLKYVPANATAFSVGNGIDLTALYRWITDFVKTNVPEGETGLAQLAAAEQQMGMSIEKDLIGWIQGGFVSVSLPGVTPSAPGQFALLLKVRDEAKAKEMIAKLDATLTGTLGPALVVADAALPQATGFKTYSHQALAITGWKPVLGVHGGYLMLGSTPEALKSVLETGSGAQANVSKNERFAREGLAPSGNVVAVSFSDLTNLGDQLSQMLQGISMVGYFVPEAGKDPFVSTMLSMLSKAGRVAKKLDFFSSTASVSTMEGKEMEVRMVTTFREPPAPPTKPVPPDQKPASTPATP
jgi:hypothetical protein